MISLSDFNYTLYDQNDRLSFLRRLIANLGNPDRNFKIIHVAGTNGKGSTATMIARILAHHGYKVGLFTSPHIIDNCESIIVNGQKITTAQMQTKIQEIVKIITYQLKLDPLKSISQFEILFVVALLFFSDQSVDYAILECGLGGQTDATNAIATSAYEIFTHIALDHTAELGNTLEKITTNKAGIIRKHSKIIVAPCQKETVENILTQFGQRFDSEIYFTENLPSRKEITLSAPYQYANFATVLKFFEIFGHGEISKSECIQTINHFELEGRFATIRTSPRVILDCAHNPDGIQQFIESVNSKFANTSKIIITGFLKDKSPEKCIKMLTSLNAHWIITEPDHSQRKYPAQKLFDDAIRASENSNSTFEIQPSPVQAYQTALKECDKDTVIFIVGSFYLARPILSFLRKELS